MYSTADTGVPFKPSSSLLINTVNLCDQLEAVVNLFCNNYNGKSVHTYNLLLSFESNVCFQVFLCVLDKTLCEQEQEESLEEALECVNENIENLSLLTDFPIGAYIFHLIMVHQCMQPFIWYFVCIHACFIKFVPDNLKPHVFNSLPLALQMLNDLYNRWMFFIVCVQSVPVWLSTAMVNFIVLSYWVFLN